MKKQYIKPLTIAHTLNAEQPLLAGSFKTKGVSFDRVAPIDTKPLEKANYGIETKWKWGNGDDSSVDVD